MDRRHFLLSMGASALLPRAAWAHHGWSGYDAAVPVYIAGAVKRANWENPHATLVIAVPATLALPGDLATRPVPAQQSPVDGRDILTRAVLPPRQSPEWTVELAPLARVQAWKVDSISEGEKVEVIGYILRMQNAPPYMRAEYLFHAGKAYALRSGPA